MDNKPYWLTGEVPDVCIDGKQVYKHFKKAGVLELTTVIEANGETKEVRRQAIRVDKIRDNLVIQDMLMSFMENAGLVWGGVPKEE